MRKRSLAPAGGDRPRPRAAGKLGVRCFLFPDGTLTLDPGLCLEKARQGTGAL